MIKQVKIENYKCYKKTVFSLKELVVVVGSNNAGKSTLIEALRLVAYAAGKYCSANYSDLPMGFGLPRFQKGFKINTDYLMIDLKCAIHQLDKDSIATIDVEFESKEHILVYISSEIAYACVKDSKGIIISSRTKAKALTISPVKILPQLGLIKDCEKRITNETIEKHFGTRLSSRHFRNELLLYKPQYYKTFVEMAQSTWDGLRIQGLESGYGDDPVSLLVYDGSFAAEIGEMGSGLQMWLQIIWFLSRCDQNDTIILDEPDVYMHPDMQRKVFEIVTNRFKQVIIATHSVEIISKTDPHFIASINRNSRQISYANTLGGAQSIIDEIGGVQNLSLLRLGTAKKCIFVEGDDLGLLSRIYRRIYPNKPFDFDSLPVIKLGGKGRFEESLGTAKLFFDETKGQIQTICILDRDYSPDEEVEKYNGRAKASHLDLHIWKKKEIENYLATPSIVFDACHLPETERKRVYKVLDRVADGFLEEVRDEFSQKLSELYRGSGQSISTLNRMAREIVKAKWTNLEEKMSLINGKMLIKMIREAVKQEFNIIVGRNDLLNAITLENVSPELVDVLTLITK